MIINMIFKVQSSQRQLLINRAKNFQISKRLKNNLEELQQKTQRLSHSRFSSISNKSLRQQRLNYSMEVRQKSPKIKMLESIVDKLKCPKMVVDRKSEISTQDNILREDIHQLLQLKENGPKVQVEKKVQKVDESSPTRHKNKLQAMLKGIKRCNQQSTKAVSSIKKIYPNLINPQLPNQKYFSNIKQEMNEQMAQAASLRQQLKRVKEQNKLLIQIIKINQFTVRSNSSTYKCSECGCSCANKPNKAISLFEPKKNA